MSFQERKPKTRSSTKQLGNQPDSEEAEEDISMEFKTHLPHQLNSRNRVPTEPKKMMKKMRSVKLQKLCSLKSSSRQSTSQLDWPSTDSSTSDSSSNQSNSISFSDGKKDSFQGESEYERNSPGSSSNVSAATVPLSLDQNRGTKGKNEQQKKISKLKKPGLPGCFRPFDRHAKPRSSDEVSEASPDLMQDNGNSAEPNSGVSSQKSLQTLTKSPSVRTGRKLKNKASFKYNSPSVKKNSKISQDSDLGRATCSSTLKDSKFPKEAEPYPGQGDSEIISVKKVCPYHHCSLHGHTHAPEPPQRRFLFKRRGSMKTQKSAKPKGLSTDGVTSSGDKKKALQSSTGTPVVKYHKGSDVKMKTITKPRAESFRETSQDKENARNAEIQESSNHVGSANENSNLIQKDPVVEQITLEPVFPMVREISDRFGIETKQEEFISETENMPLNGDEIFASNPRDGISIAPSPGLIEDELSTLIQVSASDNSGEATKGNNEIFSTSCLPVEELDALKEVKNDKPGPDRVLFTGSSLVRKIEPSGYAVGDEDDKVSANIHEGSKLQFKKNNHVSMWHMIHQQMVLGLGEEAENKQHDPNNEEEKAVEANKLPETNSSHLSPDIYNSEIDTEDDQANQDLELRKIFAIKLVREAIEKILLPEVDDQSSDIVSTTSDAISDEDLIAENREKGEEQSISTFKVVADKSFDADKASQTKKSISVLEGDKAGKNDKQKLKGWSNLKKIILLKRFVKELERVKKINPAKPRHLPLEPESEAEKISLRRQLIGEKKNSEEWMLDYALRQAVSQLAPTQKRKVAMLVKAFETVVPTQEDQHIQVEVAVPKNYSQEHFAERDLCESVSETTDAKENIKDLTASNIDSGKRNKVDAYTQYDINDLRTPIINGAHFSCASSKLYDTVNDSHDKVPVEKDEEIQSTSYLNSDLHNGNSKLSKLELDNSSDVASKSSFAISSSSADMNEEENIVDIVLPTSDAVSLEKQSSSKEKTIRESGPEHLVLQELPHLIASNGVDNQEPKTQLDKKNIKMWHMIYQHVVSGIAEKVGTQLLDQEDEEQGDDAYELPEEESSSFCHDDDMGKDNYAGKKDRDTNNQKIEFSRSTAVKMVQEAVDEILLPDIEEDSSDSQSIASDIFPDQELIEKNHGDDGELIIFNSVNSAEQSLNESERSKAGDGLSMEQEKKASTHGNINTQEYKKAMSLLNSRGEKKTSKNWSKLKKLILLKRSIKALENARKLNSKPPQQLPLARDPEAEKIELRRQMMDERKKAEQWMLDYAVRHIVTKLTPARKRRVSMLVEAFEAVVPLPEA